MDKKKEQKLLNEKMDVHDDDEDTMSNTETTVSLCVEYWFWYADTNEKPPTHVVFVAYTGCF